MKIKSSSIVWLLVLISIGILFAQDMEDFVKEGESKFTSGAYSESIELFNKAIEENPADAKAYRRRGRSKRFSGNHTAALNDYVSSLNLNGQEANTYIGRAQTLVRLQNYEAALQDYQTALRIDPDSPHKKTILYNTAWIYQELKKFKEALEHYDQVLDLDPNHQKSLVNRAFIKYQQNQIQSACEDWILAKDLGNVKADKNAQRACQCCL